MGNNASNVTFGKPKISGAIFTAPLNTALPTSASAELNEAFKCLGYVSDDGVKNSNGPSSNSIKAWGGDKALNLETEKPDNWKVKFIEALNIEVLKAVYGDDNVSGTLQTGITVRANSIPREPHAWVIDMLMAKGVMRRIVIPNGTITAIEEIEYKDENAVGYDCTISAAPGNEDFGYDTHKEYITAPAAQTSAAQGSGGGE